MNNLNLTQSNFEDRAAACYLSALGAQNLKFTPKFAPQTEKNPNEAILIHVSGEIKSINPAVAGIKINMDLWPNRNCTEEDKKKFFVDGDIQKPKALNDITMRFGFYHQTDAITGERTVVAGKPKWVDATLGEDTLKLSGEARTFIE